MKSKGILFLIELAVVLSIGAILLWFDQRIFFLFFFFYVIFALDQRTNHLRKTIRIFWVESTIYFMAILKNLNIPDEEFQKAREAFFERCTDEDRRSIQKDLDDIMP